MNAEAHLIAMLVGFTPLASRINGVYLNAADESTPLPYVVVTGTHDPNLTLHGDLDVDHVTFTIACWGAGASIAEMIADLVGAALDTDDGYAVIARTGGFDEQTANDAAVITADLWIQ